MRITTFYGFRPANLVRSLWIVCRFFLELSPGITSSKGSSFQLCWITYLKIQSTEVCFGLPQTHTVAAPKPFPDGKMFLTKNAPSSLYAGKKKTLEWKSYSSDEFQEIVIHKESFLKPPQKGEKCQQETKSVKNQLHCCWWVKSCIDLVDDPWLVVFHTSSVTQESDHQRSETVDKRQKNCVGFSISLTLQIITTFTRTTNRLKKDPGCPKLIFCAKKKPGPY